MTFAAFGITGDLMRLKILPALYGLHDIGTLPANMRIVGISRKPWNDTELRSYIKEVLPHAEEPFLSCFTFLQGDAEDPSIFSALLETCGDDDVLVYLSLSPALYKTVFSHMHSSGFGARAATTRLMIEKPLGINGVAAEELYAQLKNITAEQHIYFVDHYIAKDWIRSLETPPVSRKEISHIHISLFETIGVEKRGVSYDQLGALRDVGQNHALQMAANILAPDSSRSAHADALEKLPILSPADVSTQTTRAQYRGYEGIKGVAPGSQTETYFKIHTTLQAEGWDGVELTIEGGKSLPNSSKHVLFVLRDGRKVTVSEVPNKVGEYELLLSAAMKGDQSLFPSMREIRAQWRFIDPIIEAWSTGLPKLMSYEVGSVPGETL
jgi:glucose-6-phosphate 1-dehydrogenase